MSEKYSKAKFQKKSKYRPSLSFLNGKKIVKIGFADCKIEGGLMIDYLDGDIEKRLILGYTELGEWIEWKGLKGK